jgi:hypothetical protein
MTTSYCTPGDLADFTGASYSGRNIGNALLAIETASRTIDETCHQFFYDTETASARTFRVRNCDRAYVDPFHTTTGLVIATDHNDDGTYSSTWSVTDYELGRFNDRPDAPYDTIYGSLGVYDFPTWGRRRDSLQVTARWGWASVPVAIKRACLVLAAEMMKDPDTPFGVAGFDNFGAVRTRANPRVEQALAPYIRYDRAGIG